MPALAGSLERRIAYGVPRFPDSRDESVWCLEDRLVDIVSDGVDIAIRSGIDPPDSGSLIAQPLMIYGRVLVASPATWIGAASPRRRRLWQVTICCSTLARREPRRDGSFSGRAAK